MSASLHPGDVHRRQHRTEKRNKLRAADVHRTRQNDRRDAIRRMVLASDSRLGFRECPGHLRERAL